MHLLKTQNKLETTTLCELRTNELSSAVKLCHLQKVTIWILKHT